MESELSVAVADPLVLHSTRLHNFLRSRWARWLILPTVATLMTGFTAGALVWHHYAAEAKKYDLSQLPQLSQGTRVLDREGNFVGTVFSGDRKFIKLAEVPRHLIDALIATEDARFFQHSGVDMRAIARAFVANLTRLSVRQGGSTITQQLSRQAFDLKGRTLQRKLIETFIARRLERIYSKDQILEFYLNEIYLGTGFYGIGSAARGYFGKEVKDLTPEESALLAGIIKAPNSCSPCRSMAAAQRVRDLTIERMQWLGMITMDAAQAMKTQAVTILPEDRRMERPDYVIAALERELEANHRGAAFEEIRVTVDVALQSQAAEILKRHIDRVERVFAQEGPAGQPLEGAVIILDNQTGEILTTIGGRDYRTSPFDRALQGQRPAGTAFLPLAYAAIISVRPEMGSAWVLDGPLDNRRAMVGGMEGTLGEWGNELPTNVYEGHVSALYALLRGKTGAAVRLAYQAGVGPARSRLQSCFASPLREQASVLLGSSSVRLAEMARAYSAIAMAGEFPPCPRLVTCIRKHDGSEVELPSREQACNAFTQPAALLVRGVLTANLRQPPFQAVLKEQGLGDSGLAGFGGTAYGFTDAWFVGSDQRVTCAVWMGYDETRSIGKNAWAKDTAFPLWAEVMAAATKGAAQGWPMPDGTPAICLRSGAAAGAACRLKFDPAMLIPFPVPLKPWVAATCPFHGTEGGKGGPPPGVAEVFDLRETETTGRKAAMSATSGVRSVKPGQAVVVGPDPYESAPGQSQ
ncbi:MAG: transglycosylase domain-containing protein [Prosthecobacter sp.]|nr:transglycosylase domain-containing protein [Prosthecobacter sp.]